MDNRKNLEIEVKRLSNFRSSSFQSTNYWFSNSLDANEQQFEAAAATCCGGSGYKESYEREENHLTSWFNCMWTSAKACSSGENADGYNKQLAAGSDDGYTKNRATRFIEYLFYLAKEIYNYQVKVSRLILDKLRNIVLIMPSVWHLWATRWRSPIIQRLFQSMLVHFIYITSLLLAGDENLEDK